MKDLLGRFHTAIATVQCKCGAWHSGLYGKVCPDCHSKGVK